MGNWIGGGRLDRVVADYEQDRDPSDEVEFLGSGFGPNQGRGRLRFSNRPDPYTSIWVDSDRPCEMLGLRWGNQLREFLDPLSVFLAANQDRAFRRDYDEPRNVQKRYDRAFTVVQDDVVRCL